MADSGKPWIGIICGLVGLTIGLLGGLFGAAVIAPSATEREQRMATAETQATDALASLEDAHSQIALLESELAASLPVGDWGHASWIPEAFGPGTPGFHALRAKTEPVNGDASEVLTIQRINAMNAPLTAELSVSMTIVNDGKLATDSLYIYSSDGGSQTTLMYGAADTTRDEAMAKQNLSYALNRFTESLDAPQAVSDRLERFVLAWPLLQRSPDITERMRAGTQDGLLPPRCWQAMADKLRAYAEKSEKGWQTTSDVPGVFADLGDGWAARLAFGQLDSSKRFGVDQYAEVGPVWTVEVFAKELREQDYLDCPVLTPEEVDAMPSHE